MVLHTLLTPSLVYAKIRRPMRHKEDPATDLTMKYNFPTPPLLLQLSSKILNPDTIQGSQNSRDMFYHIMKTV